MPDEIGDGATDFQQRPGTRWPQGRIASTAPAASNHGPVRVRYVSHFAYEDGAPYVPLGPRATPGPPGRPVGGANARTLRTAPFNKMRMCVFPKSYVYNQKRALYYPFERDAAGHNISHASTRRFSATWNSACATSRRWASRRPHPVPSLRPLGLRNHGGGGGRPVSAVPWWPRLSA